MIQVTCPTCTSQFSADEQYAGRAAKCPNCGNPLTIPFVSTGATPPPTPAPQGGPPSPATPSRHDGVSIAGFVCGVCAFVLSLVEVIPCIGLFVIPIVLPIMWAGMVCSVVGLVHARRANRSKLFAIMGLVFSVLAVVWAPLVFFLFLGGLSALGFAAGSGL